MTPTPSESILIIRIIDALSDSGKTPLGIANYIKAKYYRVESTHEIISVIRKYLLEEKVLFESFYGLYKLKNRVNSSKKIDPTFENRNKPKKQLKNKDPK